MDELSLGDQVCLAVIGEGPTHGWVLVKLLAPDGELGRIWSLSRPLTYRAIDRLVERGLVTRTLNGRRAELSCTPAGRKQRRIWLRQPVDHLRELRTVFLLKHALCRRSGSPTARLLAAQRRHLAPAIAALTAGTPSDPVDLWRYESAQAAHRFLDRLDHPAPRQLNSTS